jgi:hypothetical protein
MHVAMVQQVNERFALRKLEEEPAPELDPFRPLPEALEQLGVEVPGDLVGYLETLPTSIAATLVTVASVAARSGIPLMFAWLAGYDYELTVAQADRAAGSAITVILRGPSPSDVAGSAV